MSGTDNNGVAGKGRPEREVVILMSDMIRYSHVTAHMRPDEVRDFIINYHNDIERIVSKPENQPAEIEPLAGDGAMIIFEKLPGEDRSGVTNRALNTALKMAHAIARGDIQPTRMGLYLGDIIEAKLGTRKVKFGSSFSVATRLEELCGYFGTCLLMDKKIAGYQRENRESIVSVGKVMLKAFSHPVHIFTVYEPGLHHVPKNVAKEQLQQFITLRNTAIEHFCGNSNFGIVPDFPKAREAMERAQEIFVAMTGREDKSTDRILEYIRETPVPAEDFILSGMKLSGKKRDNIGARLFHLSSELLKALNHEFYHALVVDTGWERHFKLEWRKKGETIITIHDIPDGVYFIDSGDVVTLNEDGQEIAHLSPGTIFGEMAYFSEEKKRTATVQAQTDVVIRRISSEDLVKLPVIMKIFEKIAMARR